MVYKEKMKKYSIIVIGAGAGGLVVAIGAAKAGKRVLLIEKGKYGGDCTHFGCIPSKSLIASAEAAYTIRQSERFGLEGTKPFDRADRALDRVRSIVSEVAAHEDPPALQKLGVHTLTGTARFIDPHHLEVICPEGKEQTLYGKNIIIATGSSPLIPSIPGLEGTPFHTNETIFALEKIPKHLAVLGGGPIGCELAQAFRRLGAEVSLIHRRPFLLKKEEEEAQEVIAKKFADEGVQLYLDQTTERIAYEKGEFTLFLKKGQVNVDTFLVSVGRQPNVSGLQLEKAGVRYSEKGIPIDGYGRTNRSHIWAIGDVVGGAKFTHLAENHGRAVLFSLLSPFKKSISRQPIPRVTFTDPEVASVGLLEREVAHPREVAIYTIPFSQVDRAITADRTEGFVKVITKKMSSKIIGATIVGPRAGEMLGEISTAMAGKISLRKLADIIHPYPTYNQAIRKAADLWLIQTFLPFLKKFLKGFSLKRWLPILIILLFIAISYFTGVYKYISFETLQKQHRAMQSFVEVHPVATPVIYIAIYAFTAALCLPIGIILSLLGGFLFPIPWSTLYVVTGATIGSSIIFLAARSAIGDFLEKRAGPFLKKMEKGFKKNAWSYLLFLRFIPVFPFWLVNIAPAFFGVSFLTYLWTTFVGIIPGAYVFTQTGAGLGAIFASDQKFSINSILNIQLKIALVVLGIFALFPIVVKKILEKRKRRRK
ncbi:MAG: Mercuric reductase [Chlamydiae bacterium]|nr:Mercuric reductase [Chlamydiota bacterium]